MSRDPYEVLGVARTASADEIKKAYRKIVRETHPDLNPDDPAAEERFIEATVANDLLKDPEQRARFDKGEIDASGAEKPQRQYYRDFADSPDNPYQSQRRASPGGFEGFDTSDIFEEILRQRGQGRGQGSGDWQFNAPGQDRRYALDIGFLEAARGASKRITLPNGESLDVRIPAGTADGQTLRLRGKGEAGSGSGPAGDALVSLSVRPHKLFRREGDDILITLPISIDEAILGGSVQTPTIDGPVSLKIPEGASSGQVLRLRARGVQRGGQKKPGDQRVELRIVAPRKIDDALSSFMESWRETHGYDPREGMTS